MPQDTDDLGAVRIVVEALEKFEKIDQERIIRWAREKLGLSGSIPAIQPIQALQSGGVLVEQLESAGKNSNDIKTFMGKKSPKGDNQFAAAVAYFYKFEAREDEKKEAIVSQDLLDACRLVGRKRPTRPAQTLINAQVAGLLDKKDNGYSINTVGENMVAMVMPTEGVQGVSRRILKKAKSSPRKNRKQKS